MTTVRIFFEKCGESAYISLLDLQRVFHRMLKMSSLPVYYTAMVRSAAKNWKDVGVVTAADQYEKVLAELKANGKLSNKLRFELSVAAFNRISQYDGAISNYLSSVKFEEEKLSEEYVPARAEFPGHSGRAAMKS